MKKRLAMIVTMLMVTVSLAACGGKKDTAADKEEVINTEAVEEVAETEEPATEEVEEATETEEPATEEAAEQETTGKLESNTTSKETTAVTQTSDNNTNKSDKSSNSGSKAGSSDTKSSAGSTVTAGTTTSNAGGTTGSSNNTNTSGNSAAPAHVHTWVLHEGSGHYETQVVREAWDEPVYEMREVTRCSACEVDISNWSEEQIGQHIEAHMLAGENGGYYSTGEKVQTGTRHHDAETKQVWVQDVAPYAQCSGCGEIGPVGSGISIN